MMELEKFDDINVSNVINTRVKSHQDIVDVFEHFVKVGKAEFNKVCKDCECMGNRLGDLEKEVSFCKRNCDVTKQFLNQLQKRPSHHNINVMPLPSPLVEHDDLRFNDFFTIGCCPFCGLGFAHMWVGKLASCKHMYRSWCVVMHYSSLLKCIHLGCEEEMNDVWSSFVKIIRPDILVVLKPKLKAPRPKLVPKHYTIISLKV